MQDNLDFIKEILGELADDGSQQTGDGGELVFGERDDSTGLVFELSTDEDDVPQVSEPKLSFEEVDQADEHPVELSVPTKFEVNEKYNAPLPTEDAPRIITTYVPRFTEASENYRMLDDPRPDTRAQQRKTSPSAEPTSATAEFSGDIDPTAEIIPSAESEAIEVSFGKPEPETLESASTVFKFRENEPSPTPAPRAETVQSIEENDVSDSLSVPTVEQSESSDSGDREYSIPDPVDEELSVEPAVSATLAVGQSLEDAPKDVGDASYPTAKKGAREYTAFSQRDSFKDRFLDTVMSVRVRFFAALFFAILALPVECLFVFGVDIPEILNLSYVPGAMAILDLQFILSLYLIAIPETVLAFKRLARGRLTSEMLLTVELAVLAAYTVAVSVIQPSEYPLFGLLFGISVLASVGASYFKESADFVSFKRVAANGEKIVVDRKYTRSLESENAALDGAIEEHRSKIARIFKTLFVPDFFKRSAASSEKGKSIGIIIGASLGLSLLTAAVAYFIPGGWDKAVSAFTLVFMLSIPSMTVMLHKLPFYHASVSLDTENSAVIGEGTLADYAGIDVIAFEDTDVFGDEDVSLQRIILYGNNDNLTKALRQMSALFMNIGGPLDLLFSDSLDRKCAPAKGVRVYGSGLSGDIDGNRVLAGTLEFMAEQGVEIPNDELVRRDSANESMKVMYAAENGEIYAKFIIRYSFSEEFSMLLPTLEDEGIVPLVYTRDPNVTSSLVLALTAGADKIRVIKLRDVKSSESVVYKSVSAGMVVTGDKNNAINAILLSKKYAALQSRFAITQFISMTVGGVLAAVLAIGGMSLVPSFALAAWQAVWCGALHVISKRSLKGSDIT